MVVSTGTFEQIALAQPERHWELDHGALREKPAMSFKHNDIMFELVRLLQQQLDPLAYRVRADAGHVRHAAESYYIPDVYVVPYELTRPPRNRESDLEVYDVPLPLVVEIWSPSTGHYDVDAKIPAYQARGDREIWRIHPYEQTLIAWRRQPDGRYTETIFRDGAIEPVALPNAKIDLATIFG